MGGLVLLLPYLHSFIEDLFKQPGRRETHAKLTKFKYVLSAYRHAKLTKSKYVLAVSRHAKLYLSTPLAVSTHAKLKYASSCV